LIVPPWFAGASALVDSLYLQPKRLMKKAKTIEAKLSQNPVMQDQNQA
jgi:hypothetical protein